MQSSKTRSGSCQCETLDERYSRGIRAAGTRIGARMLIKGIRTACLVQLVPALKSPRTDTCVPGESGEWNLILDMKSEDLPAFLAVHQQAYVLVLSRAARAC